MSTYDASSDLTLTIDSYELEAAKGNTAGGWPRLTTLIHLYGNGHEGIGEDVIWDEEDQVIFQLRGRALPLAGNYTLEGFSRHLDGLSLFPEKPVHEETRIYRRWALESAALDLALRQNDKSLATALGRGQGPVRFVCSVGLGDPPSLAPLHERIDLAPGLHFKLDPDPSWDDEFAAELASLGVVDVLDFKGHYSGTVVDTVADTALYERLIDAFPDAVIEDPHTDDEVMALLGPHQHRVSWDAPIHSAADVQALPFPPKVINIKPSRFGSIRRLMETYDYCEANGIAMYGGGQMELGVGRQQIQYLASIFHPDAPNDIAPSVYNESELPEEAPSSPLPLPAVKIGFR